MDHDRHGDYIQDFLLAAWSPWRQTAVDNKTVVELYQMRTLYVVISGGSNQPH